MRRKWFPFFLVILLVTSPFASVSEVYAMSHSSKEDEPEDRDKESDVDEQDSSTDEAVSEEIKLKLGDDDEQILDLKEDLTELGFAALEKPTTYYGLHTEEAVKAFQEFYDIEDTGVADEDTLLQIEYILADDSFDREEHLEFSKPEEFVTEEEEVEELPEAEAREDAEPEAEESSEEAAEEGSEVDAEENAEEAIEEDSEAEAGESSEEATDKDAEADAEENAEEATDEDSEAEAGEGSEEATDKDAEADTEESAEEATEEETEADTEESAEEATEEDSEAEESSEEAAEEDSEADTEENAELEEEQEINIQSFARATVFSASSTYQKGDRHSDIAGFKRQLNAIGFSGITVTNYYGSYFEGQVKRFQEYYGLTANGKMNQATKNKLNSVYNSPLQRGKSNSASKSFKEDLAALGYLSLSNPNNAFGPQTEAAVKAFQRDQGLRVSGIGDEVTVAKAKELAPKGTYKKGDRHSEIAEFKKKLNAIGFSGITVTNYYGSYFEGQVKRFQEYYGLPASGNIDKKTKDKLNSVYNSPLQRGKSNSASKSFKEDLAALGYLSIANPNNAYGPQTEAAVKAFQRDNNLRVNGIGDERTIAALDEAISNRWVINHETYDVTFNQALDTQMNQLQQTDMYRNNAAYVHKNYVNGSNRTTANVNVRSSASSSSHIYGQIKKGTQVTILGSTGNWYRISYNAWRNPTRSDVSSYLNPDNNDIFQHLDLTSSVGVTASSLNNDILKGKGILAGRGQAFITAGKQHSVNEIYLISHALLETGNGSSALAKGIEVGINSSGNPVVVTSSNRSSLRNIRTTYNMYGIGAVDGNAHNGGAIRAYNEGWFSPEQAIIGGARFIRNSYIHNQYNQNTLYKMRWNPANPGYPQYATDIGWAVKQVPSIKRLYDMLNNPVFKFNITQYR